MPISPRPWAAAALLVIAVAAASARAQTDPELVSAKGILAVGDAIVLFAEVSHCATLPHPPAAQILVSTDGGKTWSKKGPKLEGSEFRYTYASATGLWVAGLHTAEDPADPFLLAPRPRPFAWDLHTIYAGPADLGSLAFGRNGGLLAWIDHVDRGSGKERVYVHSSADGGRRWKTVGRARRESAKGLQDFAAITRETAGWRIVDRPDHGFDVEHRAAPQEAWQTASAFPQPACEP